MANHRVTTSLALALWLAACGAKAAQATDPVIPSMTGGLQREFTVYLNDRRIGTHRFEVFATDGKPTAVTSEAHFDVTILGIKVYRYRHKATEQWQDGCLIKLQSMTDDDGKATSVDTAIAERCVMSYAYWNPAFLQQRRLLNPQTGEYDEVEATSLGRETIKVGKDSRAADHHRLRTSGRNIDVWYSPSGEWLQLDSAIADGKTLRYRLE